MAMGKISELIKSLHELRFSFSPAQTGMKLSILRNLSETEFVNPAAIIKYHDTLCFMQAYPDNPEILELVDRELKSFQERIETFRKSYGPEDNRLDDTGIVDTTIYYPYNILMARWLAENYGAAVDIDWDDYNEKESDPISGMLNMFGLYMENDGIDDENLSTEEWVSTAVGRNRNSLGWLLNSLDRVRSSFDLKQYIYDNAELVLKWDLGKTRAARTLAKSQRRNIYFHKSTLKKGKIDLRRSIKKAAPDLGLVSPKKGSGVINTLIRALLIRHRELYPVLYANPEEIYITSPGRGLEIFILGMKPDDRMPLETNYSALLVKNGVPIGYGISVLLFERCEIAINVFDTFRSAEASLIFEHFFRVFYHHFGAREFLMRRWQTGHENIEGLKSGSFWFYYKLGFRPIDPVIGNLARIESGKIKRNRIYRTGIKTLKNLALSDLVIDFGPNSKKPYKELEVARLGMAVTRMISENYDGDRKKASRSALKSIREILKVGDSGSWSLQERLQLERWSPLLTLIPDLRAWSSKEKRNLIRVIRSKAAPRELDYVKRLQRHQPLKSAFERIADGSENLD